MLLMLPRQKAVQDADEALTGSGRSRCASMTRKRPDGRAHGQDPEQD